MLSNRTKLKEAYLIDGNGRKSKDFQLLITEINIIESLDFPCMRMSIAVNDSTNFISGMKGNETVVVTIEASSLNISQQYSMKIYRIGPRIRLEKKETFILECASPEMQLNELTNVFGCFKDKTISEIVKTLMTDKKYLGITGKRQNIDDTFVEPTNDKFKCVIPNWRPFEVINWLGSKAVRKENKNQGGFIFWETIRGYQFKSFDKIIKDGKNQSKVFKYSYAMKNTGSESEDKYNIESISFPNLFDSTIALRNGTWAGIMSGVALDFTVNSKFPNPGAKSSPYQGIQYSMIDQYKKMEHLGDVSPYPTDSRDLEILFKKPRRNRYRANPLHLWDNQNTIDKPANQGEYEIRWEETAVYNYCRKVNFETIKLDIKVPGNVSLHAGDAIDIEIPNPIPNGNVIEPDVLYSGRYIIAGLRHNYSHGGSSLTTELTIVKDSLGIVKPK